MSDPTDQTQLRRSGAPRVIIALGMAAAIIIGSVSCAIYFLAVHGPLTLAHAAKEETFDSARRMADGFKSMFNFTPQITVNGVTEIEQASSVMELATVNQNIVEHYQWSQSWFGSTKEMELQGLYTAKAGFDLHSPCLVSVRDGRIIATLPEPKLLSIEMKENGLKIIRDENGWWNKITSEDREKAITAMQDEARTKAEQSGILTEAKTRFTEQVAAMLKAQNINTPLEINFQNATPAAANR